MAKGTNTHATAAASWSQHAAQYKAHDYVTRGPCSALIQLASQLSPLSVAGAHVLDNGCGTGTLTQLVQEQHPTLPVLAADISPAMVSTVAARARSAREGRDGWSNVRAQVLDAADLHPLAADSFSHVFSSFVLQSMAAPDQAAAEMFRVARKRSGVVAVAVWERPMCWMAPWEAACRVFDPAYHAPEIIGEAWSGAEGVKAGLQNAGFRDVRLATATARLELNGAREYARYVFESRNPVAGKLLESIAGTTWEAKVRAQFESVLREEYRDGDDIEQRAVLAVARA